MADWQDTLRQLRFAPHGAFGAMRTVVEGVEFIAVLHPVKGLSISATYSTDRTAAQVEHFVPIGATVQQVAQVIVVTLQHFRPELRRGCEPT